jgi:hypothetical protein
MLVVFVTSCGALAASCSLLERSASRINLTRKGEAYARIARTHEAQAWIYKSRIEEYNQRSQRFGVNLTGIIAGLQRRIDYHERMERKYLEASARPDLPVLADPPEPK